MNGGLIARERSFDRLEDVMFLAQNGATVEDILERCGFPTKDAFSLFMRRKGLQQFYLLLPRRPRTDGHNGTNQWIKRAREATR